jgi:hypothetical protein
MEKKKRKKIRLMQEGDFKKFANIGYVLDCFRSAFHHGMGMHDSHFHNTIPVDTAFKYLYRRFGPSPFQGDSYKDLFFYGFVVGRSAFMLHGSYETFMHLSILISKKEIKAFNARWKEMGIAYCEWLANAMMDVGIPPWNDQLLGGKKQPYSTKTKERWSEMHKAFMVAEIGLDEYNRLDALPEDEAEVKAACKDFNDRLYERFKDKIENPHPHLGNIDRVSPPWDEIPMPSHHTIDQIEDYLKAQFPNTWIDLQDFIWQMKRATNVRDVSFNLAGEDYPDGDYEPANKERLALYDDLHFGIVGLNNQVRDLRKALYDEPRDEHTIKFRLDAIEARMSSIQGPDHTKREKANKFTGYVSYYELPEKPEIAGNQKQ